MVFDVAAALDLATKAHDGQQDKEGQPYIGHPMRVMNRLSTEYERMTALLHDVLEDTEVTESDLRDAGCPQEVINAVLALTKRPGEDLATSMARAAADDLAFVVKLADIADNSDPQRLQRLSHAESCRLTRKYIESRRLLLGARGRAEAQA